MGTGALGEMTREATDSQPSACRAGLSVFSLIFVDVETEAQDREVPMNTAKGRLDPLPTPTFSLALVKAEGPRGGLLGPRDRRSGTPRLLLRAPRKDAGRMEEEVPPSGGFGDPGPCRHPREPHIRLHGTQDALPTSLPLLPRRPRRLECIPAWRMGEEAVSHLPMPPSTWGQGSNSDNAHHSGPPPPHMHPFYWKQLTSFRILKRNKTQRQKETK